MAARVTIRNGGPSAGAQATPSEHIIKAAKNETVVTAEDGRRIKIRKLDAVDKMDLTEIVGADRAKNESWMIFALLAASVIEIDGQIEPPVNSVLEIRNLVRRLGEDALGAIAQGFVDDFNAEPIDADALKN